MKYIAPCLLMLSLVVLMGGSSGGEGESPAPRLQEALRKARAGGKYEMLLLQVEVANDQEKYANFRELGRRDVRTYAGHTDLPAGHWVYVAPYWYIWRNLSATPKQARAWGPEQATGPPDTPGAGDIQTAWASLTPDGQDEWLLLEYAEPVVPSAVVVHETYNPGALDRVTVFKLDGEEVQVWSDVDPTPVGSPRGESEVTFKVGFKTNRVKLYINSRAVAGWNEIDAVGLRDTAGKTHWATSAHASSTYAEQGGGRALIIPAVPPPAPAPAAPAPKQPPGVPGAGR